jgi:hypothetical protein
MMQRRWKLSWAQRTDMWCRWKALTLAEREDISGGIASGCSLRDIAQHLSRASSTMAHGGTGLLLRSAKIPGSAARTKTPMGYCGARAREVGLPECDASIKTQALAQALAGTAVRTPEFMAGLDEQTWFPATSARYSCERARICSISAL